MRGTSGLADPTSNPFTLKNPVTPGQYRFNPSSPFFSVAKVFTDEDRAFAEDYALQASELTSKPPLVISFQLNEKNFPLLKEKIFRLRRNEQNSFDEVPVTSLEDLLLANQVLIDGSKLTPEQIGELGAVFGTGKAEGQFDYKDSRELGFGKEGAPQMEAAA